MLRVNIPTKQPNKQTHAHQNGIYIEGNSVKLVESTKANHYILYCDAQHSTHHSDDVFIVIRCCPMSTSRALLTPTWPNQIVFLSRQKSHGPFLLGRSVVVIIVVVIVLVVVLVNAFCLFQTEHISKALICRNMTSMNLFIRAHTLLIFTVWHFTRVRVRFGFYIDIIRIRPLSPYICSN